MCLKICGCSRFYVSVLFCVFVFFSSLVRGLNVLTCLYRNTIILVNDDNSNKLVLAGDVQSNCSCRTNIYYLFLFT